LKLWKFDMKTNGYLASPEILARARKIKLFLMDVDGTLTDGGVCPNLGYCRRWIRCWERVGDENLQRQGWARSFACKYDGHPNGFHYGSALTCVAKRAEELKVTFVYLGQAKKTDAFEECVEKAGVTKKEVAYMGDDLPDIPLALRAGLAISVADGAEELKAVCHYITRRLAGHGAAREVIELILKAQGRWEDAVPLALA
jgi:3-deoxy-D-manno-octulosonate 8-phosphate phosphatase (KDO 8-P phosphatase)